MREKDGCTGELSKKRMAMKLYLNRFICRTGPSWHARPANASVMVR